MAGKRGRKRVCVLCGLPIDDPNNSVPYKNRYAHDKCFRAAVKAVHIDKTEKLQEVTSKKKTDKSTKPQIELKEGLTEEEYTQKKIYYDYLKNNIPSFNGQLPVKVYAVTERYIKKYGFTFQKMYQTLIYINDILEKEFTEDIVGLIPYYYDEAGVYYNQLKTIEENNKGIDTTNMYKHKIVYIDTRKRKIKQLDIQSIGEE